MGILNTSVDFNIYILIFLWVIFILIGKNIKITYFSENNTQTTFLKELDYFFMKNKLITFFAIGLYFGFSSLIFLFLRLQIIGSSTVIIIPLSSFEFNSLFNILLFLINIRLYLQILDMLFYRYILQLHFYLYKMRWYIKFNDLNRDHYMFVSNYFLKIISIIYEKYENKWYYNVILVLLNYLHSYASRFIYYMPVIFIIISMFYELHQGVLYYSYYILLFYLIITFVRKIRKFFYEKDCVYDNVISKHFYGENAPYLLKKDLDISNKSLLAGHFEILNYTNEIIDYFKNGLKAYYLLDPLSIENNQAFHSTIKKLYIILLLISSNIYFMCNIGKYKILLSFISFELQPLHILIPLLIMTFILYYYKFKKLFVFIILLQGMFIIFIMLKNKIILTPQELLLNWEFISIREAFSVEEKKEYSIRYVNLISSTIFNNTKYEIIYKEWLIEHIIITNELSMEELRKVVHGLLISLASNNK